MATKEQVWSRGNTYAICSLDDRNWSWLYPALLQDEGGDPAQIEPCEFLWMFQIKKLKCKTQQIKHLENTNIFLLIVKMRF
jgi:hypothetical protein